MKFRLSVDIDHLDYASALRAIIPHIKREYIPLPDKVIDFAQAPGVIENFLKLIPQEKQDEMILAVFDKYKEKMINKAEKSAAGAGVDISVSDVTLSERK